MTSSVNKTDILSAIEARVRERLNERKRRRSLEELRSHAALRKPHDLTATIRASNKLGRPFVISEIKYRSPSQGDLGCRLSPVEVAQQYLKHGASALSILTEQDFFAGSRENLRSVRREFPEALLLMKDFIIDEYQIIEAAADGADSVLLIVSMLGEIQTGHFMKTARDLGLTALVEVHTKEEMEAACRLQAPLVGVNNRNLSTLEVKINTSVELAPMKKAGMTLICESGIGSSEQIYKLKKIGFDGFLVGHSLMKADSPGLALANLLRAGPGQSD